MSVKSSVGSLSLALQHGDDAEFQILQPDKVGEIIYIDLACREIGEIGFDDEGEEQLFKVGYIEWVLNVNYRRTYILHLPPLPEATMRALWIYVTTWYTNHAVYMKKKKAMNCLVTAINQSVHLVSRFEDHWNEFTSDICRSKTYRSSWKNVDFSGVRKYLTNEAKKYPDVFTLKSHHFLRNPKRVISAEEMVTQRLENLTVKENGGLSIAELKKKEAKGFKKASKTGSEGESRLEWQHLMRIASSN